MQIDRTLRKKIEEVRLEDVPKKNGDCDVGLQSHYFFQNLRISQIRSHEDATSRQFGDLPDFFSITLAVGGMKHETHNLVVLTFQPFEDLASQVIVSKEENAHGEGHYSLNARTKQDKTHAVHEYEVSPWKDQTRWNAFVDSSLQGSIFCRLEYLEALKTRFQIFDVRSEGKTLAAFPVIFEKDNFTPISSPHYFTLYQGILFDPSVSSLPPHSRIPLQGEIVKSILNDLAKNYDRISLGLHYHFEDLREFLWFHSQEGIEKPFQLDLRYTGIISLNGTFEDSVAATRKARQYESRKAQKAGCAIESGTKSEVEMFCNLYQETFRRQNREETEPHMKLYRDIILAALEHRFGEFLFCRTSSGEVVSASLFLQDTRASYYLFNATDPDPRLRATGGNTLLLMENIRRAQERGSQWIDTVGINSPGRGDFKISWNAEPRPYFAARWSRA